MRSFVLAAASLLLALPAAAQVRGVTNVGLVFESGLQQYGQVCGSFECRPHQAVGQLGGSGLLRQFGPPGSPYAIAIGLPGTRCIPSGSGLTGLLLLPGAFTYQIGTIGALNPRLPCRQGSDEVAIRFPARLGSGFSFLVQSVGLDGRTGGREFTEPIAVTLR